MPYNRGERMKLSNSLTARDRRRMGAQLTAAAEAVESAQEAMEKLCAEFWSKGLTLNALMGATGVGYENLHKALRAQGLDVDPE